MTTQREQPRSAASARLGGRALPAGRRRPRIASRMAPDSRACSGPWRASPSSRSVSHARLVWDSDIASDYTSTPIPGLAWSPTAERSPTVRQRQLSDGRVSLQVSQLCLGTMYFGYRTDEPTSIRHPRPLPGGGRHLPRHRQQLRPVARRGRRERAGHRPLAAVPGGDRPGRHRHQGGRAGPCSPATPAPTTGRASAPGRSGRTPRPACASSASTGWTCTTPTSTTGPPRRRRPSTPWPSWPSAGTVGLLGASNHATWRIERARAIARAGGRPAYQCVQQEHSYLLPWPGPRPGQPGHRGADRLRRRRGA